MKSKLALCLAVANGVAADRGSAGYRDNPLFGLFRSS